MAISLTELITRFSASSGAHKASLVTSLVAQATIQTRTVTVLTALTECIRQGGLTLDESPLYRGKARKALSDSFLVMPVNWSGAQYNALSGAWMQDLPAVNPDGEEVTRFLRVGVTTYRPEEPRLENSQVYSAFASYTKPATETRAAEFGREVRQIHMMLCSCDSLLAAAATNAQGTLEPQHAEKLNASVTFAGEFKGSHIGYRLNADSPVPPEVVRTLISAWAISDSVRSLCTLAASFGGFHRLSSDKLDVFKVALSEFVSFMWTILGLSSDMAPSAQQALIPNELLVLNQNFDELAKWWDEMHPLTEVALYRDESIQYRLFLGNCPYSITVEQVRQLLAPANEQIVDVQIPLDPYTLRPKGIAFASFRNKGALMRVCNFLRSSPLNVAGREIRASQSIRKG